MNNPKMRRLFNQLQAMPHYAIASNTITREQAQTICERYETNLEYEERSFAEANKYGQEKIQAGAAFGMYCNATRLFTSYLYDVVYQAACEDEEARRHHEYD